LDARYARIHYCICAPTSAVTDIKGIKIDILPETNHPDARHENTVEDGGVVGDDSSGNVANAYGDDTSARPRATNVVVVQTLKSKSSNQTTTRPQPTVPKRARVYEDDVEEVLCCTRSLRCHLTCHHDMQFTNNSNLKSNASVCMCLFIFCPRKLFVIDAAAGIVGIGMGLQYFATLVIPPSIVCHSVRAQSRDLLSRQTNVCVFHTVADLDQDLCISVTCILRPIRKKYWACWRECT
jgi:hypothetical protein